MAALADMDSACLLILVEESESTGRPISAKQVAAKFHPITTESRAKLSLDHLVTLGFATANFDNWRASGYLITRNGLAAAERAFVRQDTEQNTVWKVSSAELRDLVPTGNESIKTSEGSIQTAPQVVVNVENKIDPRSTASESARISWAGWAGVMVTMAIGAITIAIMKDWL